MAKTIWWILVIGVLGLGFRVYGKAMAVQWRMRRRLKMQGVKGPTPSLFRGNVPEMQKIQSQTMINSRNYSGDYIIAHDYTSSLFPYLDHWRKQYGTMLSNLTIFFRFLNCGSTQGEIGPFWTGVRRFYFLDA